MRAPEFDDVPLVPQAADFLYIGMMRDLKGPDIFIDALAEATRTAGRPVSAVMVGAGDDLRNTARRSSDLGLSPQVTFHDPMPARQAFAMARSIVVAVARGIHALHRSRSAGGGQADGRDGGRRDTRDLRGRTDLLIRPDAAQHGRPNGRGPGRRGRLRRAHAAAKRAPASASAQT